MKWREAPNLQIGSLAPVSAATYLERFCPVTVPPIDLFISGRYELLTVARVLDVPTCAKVGPLLLVGLISESENYLRDVISRILSICPISRKAASSKTLSYGSVFWAGAKTTGRAIFDHQSLADRKSIKEALGLLGYTIREGSALEGPMNEFDKLCELRHAIVHTSRIISGKNATTLELSPCSDGFRVEVDSAKLENAALVASAFVYTVNSELFAHLSKRWAIDWRRSPSWIPSDENKLFARIWSTLVSKSEPFVDSNGASLTPAKVQKLIKAEFRVS